MVRFVLGSTSNLENNFNSFETFENILVPTSSNTFEMSQEQQEQSFDFNIECFSFDNRPPAQILNELKLEDFLNGSENSMNFDQAQFSNLDSPVNSFDEFVPSSVTSVCSSPSSQSVDIEIDQSLVQDFGIDQRILNEIKFDVETQIRLDYESIKSNKLKRIQKDDKIKKLKKKPENMKDCLHIWEFLRDLLKNAKTDGKLIKWLSKEKGLFKILSPDEVANLWAKKKSNKDTMPYPNMARGIRYSREEGGYFDLVLKEDGFGKKLVYKFSKKASVHCDWLSSFMLE